MRAILTFLSTFFFSLLVRATDRVYGVNLGSWYATRIVQKRVNLVLTSVLCAAGWSLSRGCCPKARLFFSHAGFHYTR